MSDNKKRPWVFVQGQKVFRFDPEQHDTLLEAMEANGMACHSECRAGFCGACRTRMSAGEVEYLRDTIAFMQPGEILPCSCRPVGEITIEPDED